MKLKTAKISIRSAIPGRIRWDIPALRGRPRYAAAVKVTIAREPGVLSVEATPTTGRLLLHYDASQTAESLRTLIEVALSVAPLTLADYEARQRHCEESNDMRPHSPTSDDHGHDHGDNELAKRM